ncbi:hypothetical protein SDC9_91543 [bioreactor metagenome]|uniref:Uncharacterized protein n=1 Tax=bioreactor metagenome TaxID=1076179 RepID=A0A644ZY46_9ZZZZ
MALSALATGIAGRIFVAHACERQRCLAIQLVRALDEIVAVLVEGKRALDSDAADRIHDFLDPRHVDHHVEIDRDIQHLLHCIDRHRGASECIGVIDFVGSAVPDYFGVRIAWDTQQCRLLRMRIDGDDHH